MLKSKIRFRGSSVKSRFVSALIVIFMLFTVGCNSKDVSSDRTLKSGTSNPVSELILLPHQYTQMLNDALHALPLKKRDPKK